MEDEEEGEGKIGDWEGVFVPEGDKRLPLNRKKTNVTHSREVKVAFIWGNVWKRWGGGSKNYLTWCLGPALLD